MINKNDLISIIVKPTNACNLRCKHCYHAGTGYDNEQMSDKMLEKLISSSVPHFSGIHYIWHGGEPLSMPLTFYKRALELEQKYKHNPNQNIKNSMQSNGTYVTEDVAKFIADNNILIGFSFEGPYNDFLRSHTNMTLKGYENLKKFVGLQYFRTDQTEDMHGMFFDCRKLKSLNLKKMKTDKVTDMPT